MAQRRELPPDATPIHLIGKKLLQEIAHITASRLQELAFVFFQELTELANVGRVGANRKRCQSLLNPQVVEEAGEHARVGIRSHQWGTKKVWALSDAGESTE